MDARAQEMYDLVQRHLLNANEELLGLHRVGPLSYEEYSQVANLLVDAQQLLKRLVRGEEAHLDQQGIAIPYWMFFDKRLSPDAKWTYACLLRLHREVQRPGQNALIINLSLASKDIFPTYAWNEKHLLDALEDLSRVGIITSRKMDYPDSTPEHWEIDFLSEERL